MMTNAENADQWVEWNDEYGVYKRRGDMTLVVSRTQKWKDENPPIETVVEPTPLEELTNYVLDVDYRLVLVEMGLL